eukprot:CAMPEP_0171091030 /NCGR_PEP_ID=MMETSP0766_2-20121228/32201_1 /TAXON_ID=439317 /ORGANISM="Gambierdiscus australes, Strain CAWD 149" /LENGTH=82 /DNA_ID=CAMNT_0011549087 /DNA_START=155 /DNA_END=400 /DNA_ORIENTATION=+
MRMGGIGPFITFFTVSFSSGPGACTAKLQACTLAFSQQASGSPGAPAATVRGADVATLCTTVVAARANLCIVANTLHLSCNG